jgi:hypothetical protein
MATPLSYFSVLILLEDIVQRMDKNGNTGRPHKSPPDGCKKGVSRTRFMMYQQAFKVLLAFCHARHFTVVLPSLRQLTLSLLSR